MFVRVKLDERPLGQLGGAAARLGLVVGILATVQALGQDLVSASSSQSVSILLALPALLGVTALLNAPLGTIRSSLLARATSFTSGLVALGGALLFLWWSAEYARLVHDHISSTVASRPPSGVSEGISALIYGSVALLLIIAIRLLTNGVVFRQARSNHSPCGLM